jgi:hypothetical protein
MQAMLGGDGGGAACQRASCAREPAPGYKRRPITCIEPLCFGGRRTPERRRSGLHITGGCRAICSRLMCFGVHTPPCQSRSFASWQPARYVTRIPSDSRQLLEFRQVLLRRGKQVFGCRGRLPGHAFCGRLRWREKEMLAAPAQAPCPFAVPALGPQGVRVFGHACKRPFAYILLICKMGHRSEERPTVPCWRNGAILFLAPNIV